MAALLITPLLYQRLGEEYYGLVTLGLSVVTLFSILVNYGFHLNAPKRLALLLDDINGQSRLINEIIATRLMLATILIVGLLVSINIFDLFPNYGSILAFSAIILLAEAFFPLFVLQGFDRLSLLSIGNVVSKLTYLCLIFLLIRDPNDAPWVNFLFGGSTLVVNILLIAFIYRKWGLKFEWVRFAQFRIRLTENFHFFLSTIAGHISVHGGFILLSNFVSDLELGRYALAQRVAFLLRMVPIFLTQSILQNASRMYKENAKEFHKYLMGAYKGGLLLTFLIGIFFSLTSPWVIRVLGGEFVEYSADVLRLLSFIPFLGMLNVSNMIKILVAERKEVLAKSTWVTAIVMLVLAVFGSYKYGGYGLAIALMISELVSFIVHYLFLKKIPLENRT